MFDENFWFKPIPGKMILQSLKIFDQKIFDENFQFKSIPLFATRNNSRPENFDENSWFKRIPEEMILQP